MSHKLIQLSSQMNLRYPLFGVLKRVTDKGFGFIKTDSQEYFVHLSDLKGSSLKTLEGLEGRDCAFVLGGHPFSYKKRKPRWKCSVVEWVLLDNFEKRFLSTDYAKERERKINELNLNQWIRLLLSKWYIRKWKKDARIQPQTLLRSDEMLVNGLHAQFGKCSNLRSLLWLMDSLVNSPMFVLKDEDKEQVIKQFFHPKKWPLSVFVSEEACENYKVKSFSWGVLKDSIQNYVEISSVVSIDLESNRDDIFQYGWKNATGFGVKKNNRGLSKDELNLAKDESLNSLLNPCVVGHNFINWDCPILMKNGVKFPSGFRVWDTLIISWLLEPWKESHALIVGENAHQADVDAVATYALFEEQYLKLGFYLQGKVLGVEDLVDVICQTEGLMARVANRSYPQTLRHTKGDSFLYPSSRRSELEWQVNCFIDYVSLKEKDFDPVLIASVCSEIASEQKCIYSKIIALIVGDASRERVQVRLSMIPIWLISEDDELRTIFRERNAVNAEDVPENYLYYLTGDLFRLKVSDLESWALDRCVKVRYPSKVMYEWNMAYWKALSDQVFDKEYPNILDKVRNCALLNLETLEGGREWVLRESVGLTDSQNPWKRFPVRQKNFVFDFGQENSLRTIKLARFPRWKDGSAERLNIDRLFVSPNTENRILYVADFLHCVLNLALRADRKFLIVAMRWAGEADKLENHLSQLSYTIRKSNSPLRQIEYLVNHDFKIVVCSIDHLREYVESARVMGVSCQIIIDELPLYHWYCFLHDPNKSDKKLQLKNYSELLEGGIPSFELKDADLWEALSIFLDPWLEVNLPLNYVLDHPVLVFDARIYDNSVGKRWDLPWKSCSFYPIEELLDKEKQDIYYEFCFTKKVNNDVPNSYDDYRAYLSNIWGYSNFRAGPQQEAINALVANKQDLLLRLPTGGGKSIVFHLPALLRANYTGRLTIVITPLRALMVDQVQGLWDKQFTESVDYLSGGRDFLLNQKTYQGVLDGRVKLLFVAPERFRVSRFVEVLERRRRLDGGLEFIVFDEAHCISEWGFEFRPDYLFAAQYILDWFKKKELPGNPHRLLLTSATITQRNRADLEKELGLGVTEPYLDLPKDMPHPIQPFIVLESEDLVMNREMPKNDPRLNKIIEIIEEVDLEVSAVIIFVRQRKDCHRISEYLNEYQTKKTQKTSSVLSLPFHAGLSTRLKEEACVMLKNRNVNVLVCTKAFGMGMDIPHLHACIHYQAPLYIEDYLQEVGRIGRDKEERIRANKEQVHATLLYSKDDMEYSIGLLQDKAIRPPDLQTFMGYLSSLVVYFPAVKKSVGLIPSSFPEKDGKKFDKNQVTSCLFWLNRAGILTIEGRHPPFLELFVSKKKLLALSSGTTITSRISGAILSHIRESLSVISEQAISKDFSAIESSFGRFIRGLKRGFLTLISSSTKNVDDLSGSQTVVPEEHEDSIKITISISELLGSVGGIGMDDLIAGLFELKKEQIISINREFSLIEPGIKNSNTYFKLLEYAVLRLISSTNGRLHSASRELFRHELEQWYRFYLNSETISVYSVRKDLSYKTAENSGNLVKSIFLEIDDASEERMEIKVGFIEEQREALLDIFNPVLNKQKEGSVEVCINRIKSNSDGFEIFVLTGNQEIDSKLPIPITKQNKFEVFRALKTALRLVRYSGLEVKESLSVKGISIYSRAISKEESFSLSEKAMEYQDQLKIIIEFCNCNSFAVGKTFNVQLCDLLSLFNPSIRYSRLMELMDLIDSSGFYGMEGSNNDWYSVVSLNSLQPLPNYDLESESNLVNSVNNIQSVYAEMVDKHRLQVLRAQSMVLLTVMPAENRKYFIDEYFKVQTGDEIEKLLENVVGDVDDTVIQQNEILQEILSHVRQERFDHEIKRLNPDQMKVCTAPYDENLLVNAGPGSGKTHVLMMRCAHLIHRQGINPQQILVLAFNRAVVFEIRKRIRDLFKALGYGSYVNKLDVTTFHSFALRHQEVSDQYQQEAIEDGVHTFALKIKTDKVFAKSLANQYQAILVDEFQDMNEDFYDVVDAFATYNAGGTMVIGDDDQDILGWNRKKGAFREGIEYFLKFESEYSPTKYQLLLNYRSVPEVVNRSNKMIDMVSKKIDFKRMKTGTCLDANRTESGTEESYKTWDEGLRIAINALEQKEDVAVLCRSNRECRKAYECLINLKVKREQIEVLGGVDLSLYQMRSYGALMDIVAKLEPYIFIDQYVWEEIINEYISLKYAGSDSDKLYLDRVYELIKKECGRPCAKDIFDFIRETKRSDLERLKSHHGIKGWDNFEEEVSTSSITISTIHKVKGLEFETVVILPSFEAFPLGHSDKVEAIDSAEEARLFYVAMTRARNKLFVGLGEREKKWYNCSSLKEEKEMSSDLLEGAPDEFFVSWAGQESQVKNKIQQLIQNDICDGSLIIRRNKELLYNGECVGRLSKKGLKKIKRKTTFRVAHVMRYNCGNYMKENNLDLWKKLHPDIKRQGWFYVVLVEG